ncbi:MAG: hypothetical protein E7254_09410 [Lachnospiraceae bacterium]|nr:hypothetical protein [Lachnospiraceae bacterium]
MPFCGKQIIKRKGFLMRKQIIALGLAAALTVGMVPQTYIGQPANVYANAEDDYYYGSEDESGESVDYTAIHKQEVIDEAVALGVPNAFIRHNFAEDFTEGNLEDPVFALEEGEAAPKMTVDTVTSSAGNEGLSIQKIDTGALARGKFDLGEFDFGDLNVGRLVYNMLADKKTKGTAYLFFGEAEKPFASFAIKRTANEDWEETPNRTVDLRDAAEELKGKGHIYLTFVANSALDEGGNIIAKSGVKANLYLEGMFFTEGSTPVLEFDLDNEINTIENINGSELHTTMGYGDMHVKVPDGYVSEYSVDGTPMKDATYELDYLRGRGNSTWLQSKKPYKIKLDKSTDLFGMGKSKHWVLLANYFDYSLMRNKMTFYMAEKLGLEYTPKSVFVDVVISGVYYGSYQLSQHVRIGKANVNIDDLEEDPASTLPEISGGYLLAMGDSWLVGDDENVPYFDIDGYTFKIDKPEYDSSYPEDAKEAQVAYLDQYLNELNLLVNDTIKDDEDGDGDEEIEGKTEVGTEEGDDDEEIDDEGPSYTLPEGKTWRDYMDEQSYIDYYLLQEFSKNGDAFGSGSTYLYKERDGKLFWGPVWDFDFVAWGAYSTNFTGQGGTESFDMIGRMPWFETLIKNDKEFKDKVVERWNVLSGILEDMISDGGIIDQYAEQLYYSALANYQVASNYLMDGEGYWGGDDMEGLVDDYDDPYTLNYFNEVERIKHYISVGKRWADASIEEIDTFEGGNWYYDYPAIPFYVDEEEYGFATFDEDEWEIVDIPENPVKEGFKFVGWYYTDEEGEEQRLTKNTFPFAWDYEGDMVYAFEMHAKFIPESDYVYIDKLEAAQSVVYLPLFSDGYYDSYENTWVDNGYSYETIDISQFINVYPFNANKDDITYTYNMYGDDIETNDSEIGTYELDPIEVTCKAGELECKITVVPFDYDAEENLSRDMKFETVDSVELKPGEYGNLDFKFTEEGIHPYYDYTIIQFVSTDDDIVEVNDNGALVANAEGKAYVIVITWDEDGKKLKKKVEVNVVDDKAQEETTNVEETTQEEATTVEETTTVAATTVSKDPEKATIKKVSSKKKASKKVKLTIKKAKNANAYEIAIYKSKKNAKKNIKALVKKETQKLKVSIKSAKLKNKKKLYVRVRAIKKEGNVITLGEWSDIKKIKIK